MAVNLRISLLIVFLSLICCENNKDGSENVIHVKAEKKIASSIHNAEDLFGSGKYRTKKIYRKGDLIDTINWTITPPFDSITIKRRNQAYGKVYVDSFQEIVFISSIDKSITYRAKIDSLGIKDQIIPFYQNGSPNLMRLFIKNRNVLTLSINKNTLDGFHSEPDIFGVSGMANRKKSNLEILKFTSINNDHRLIISFYDDSKIKSIEYSQKFKRVSTYDFNLNGAITLNEDPVENIIYNRVD